MSQTDNKDNFSDTLKALGDSAMNLTSFLSTLQGSLTQEQKDMISKELGGKDEFAKQMKNVEEKMAQALNDIKKFNK